MKLRTIVTEDYPRLISFWKENYLITEVDTEEHFSLFLDKNKDLSILAEDEGEILGTALGSYDGRRGYLQKVVISKKTRRQGIGKRIVQEVCQRLKKAGAVFIPISVDKTLIPFYESCGFIQQDAQSMSKAL
jgi:predicted N-acetyltransferase YhbS